MARIAAVTKATNPRFADGEGVVAFASRSQELGPSAENGWVQLVGKVSEVSEKTSGTPLHESWVGECTLAPRQSVRALLTFITFIL